jgi:SAM-dependent methyltransferase
MAQAKKSLTQRTRRRITGLLPAQRRRAEWKRRRQAKRVDHRMRVGGYWERVGKLQLEFLVAHGLEPSGRFLDVGCGALRAGVHLVDYLDAGNYYGIDVSKELLNAGYNLELSPEQREKLPRDHLRRTNRFNVDFGVQFDRAIATSVFTHLSLNHIRLCMYRVAGQMNVGGKFFFTFREAPPDFPLDGVLREGKGARYTERDGFWYWPGDLEWAASFSPWEFRYVGDWGHPRNQKMVELERTPEERRPSSSNGELPGLDSNQQPSG